MGMEIERKFLVEGEAWREDVEASLEMQQGYIASNEACSVRIRVQGEVAFLNIKGATLAIERPEFEYPLPLVDAKYMLNNFCGSQRIEKTRHLVRSDKWLWEIDEFSGDNAGLIVAEIELTAADEVFTRPPWLGKEVSEDPRYYNVKLVRHPYRDWGR
jgi:adenylate cyclase